MNDFDLELEKFDADIKKLDEEILKYEYTDEEIEEKIKELLENNAIEDKVRKLEAEVKKLEESLLEYDQIETESAEILAIEKIGLNFGIKIETSEDRMLWDSDIRNEDHRIEALDKAVDLDVDYSEMSVEDWMELVPRNNYSTFLSNYYKTYYGFYIYFRDQIESRTLKSLKPYENNFYDWFRGIMAEKEAYLLTSNAYDEDRVAGTELEVVLSDYRYICDEHNALYYSNAFSLLNRCWDKADYCLFYNEWKRKLEAAVEEGDVDFIKYVEMVKPLSDEYIPSKLFFNFININSYLTYVGEAYSDEIKEIVCNRIEKEYRETQINFLYQYADVVIGGEPDSPKESMGDRLCLYWPRDISEKFDILPSGFWVRRGDINSKKVRKLIQSCENLIREKNDLPLIGEGWISETILFKQVEAIFDKEQVKKHSSPEFLGRQHYDIYFPDHKVALEYQGIQHFEAIDLFGGEEGLKRTQERDEKKRKISEDNGVKLIEVLPDYDIRDVVKKICMAMNNTDKSVIEKEKILKALSIEEVTRKELKSGKEKLTSISIVKKKTYSNEEKEKARNRLLEIKSRLDEGQWVQFWYLGYQITYAELLEVSEDDVEGMVQKLKLEKLGLDSRDWYAYADVLKKAINYYKKRKMYDEAISITQFAIDNSVKLQEGKSFELRLEELQKKKAKEQGKISKVK